MKLHVLYDAQGRILAASRVTSDAKGPVPYAHPESGQTVHQLEVPEQHRNATLAEICRAMRVDIKTRTLAPAHPNSKS